MVLSVTVPVKKSFFLLDLGIIAVTIFGLSEAVTIVTTCPFNSLSVWY
jgi:hypothetical protein